MKVGLFNTVRGANVPVYSPNAISEHTVLLVLAALRHFRKQLLQVGKRNCTRSAT